jgi:Tfp pilus assembly protein PilF
MADELIARLGLLTGLRVVSRTSAVYFEANPAPLPEIAMRLSVDSVIEGSVAISRRKIRIAAQLVHASHDRVLWAKTYERGVDDVITIQGEIARAIALEVRARLTPREQIILAGVRPSKSAANECYLKGRFFWDKRTEPSLNSAARYFKRAATLEAEYAPAHAGLADTYVVQGILGLVPPHQAFPKAKASVETALQIDDTLVEAHATLGHIRMTYDWNWSGAEKEFKRAIKLNANYAIAHQWYGNLLTIMCRTQEAIAELKIARDLDPLSMPVNAFLGFVYMRARKYDLAVQACRSAIELDSNNPFGHWILARVFDANKELSKALTESRRAVTLSKGSLPFAAHLGYAYARAGEEFQARRIVDDLVGASRKRYVSPYLIALIYVGLGDKTCAFEWLEKAFADRAARLSELPDPPFARLRSDLRFERLLRRVGLPTA